MIAEIFAYLTLAALVSFGAIVRAVLGTYKAYNAYPDFKPEWRRIFFEVVASTVFGSFALYFLQGLGIFAFGLNLASPIAGLFGADAISLITKRFGLSKGLQVTVSKQQMQYADLNDREVRALDYVSKFGKITNKIYQKLNSVNGETAKYELHTLAEKGKLKLVGSKKGSFYLSAEEDQKNQKSRLGKIWGIYGVSKKHTQKTHQKIPIQKPVSLNSGFGTQKRNFQNVSDRKQKLEERLYPKNPQNHPNGSQ